MRELRLKEGNTVVFDAMKDLLKHTPTSSEVLVKMESHSGTYLSPHGKKFWGKHPYQWVNKKEATYLLGIRGIPSFSAATIEDAEDFYAY